jgi:(p)ppGpp synthase/HD superfamily hydrolase
MSSLIDKARKFGSKAHSGQVRKYTGEPYFTHCEAVAERVMKFVHDDEVIAAALLHDTVEDCDVSIEEIAEEFGETVAEYVWYLTKPPSFIGDRAKRKEHDRNRLRIAPEVVRLIKINDVMHNSMSIKEHDPEFWERFKEETIELLRNLYAGDIISEWCGQQYMIETFIPWYSNLAECAE